MIDSNYSRTIDSINTLVAVMNAKFDYIFVNKAYADAYRKKPSFFLGKNHFDLFPDRKSKKIFRRVVKTGETYIEKAKSFDYKFKRKQRTSYRDCALHPLKEKSGRITHLILEQIDVTDCTQTERSLKESEERLKIAGIAAYDLLYEWDVKSDHLEWYGDIDDTLGYRKKEISRNIKDWLDLIHPDDVAKLKSAVELHRRSTKPIQYEYRVKHKDGTYRYWNDHGLPLLDDEGQPYKWIGVCTDITERKRAEDEIKLERDKLHALIDGLYHAKIGIDIVGTDYRVKFQNKLLEQRFGDITGKLCYKEYMGGKKPCDFCPMKKAIESKTIETVELTGVDGRDYQLISAPLPNPDGIIDRVIEVITDITERKRAEEALRESEMQYRAIFEGVAEGILVADVEMKRFRYTNPAMCEMLGYTEEELMQLSVEDIHPKDSLDFIIAEFEALARDEKKLAQNIPCLRKDGSVFYADVLTAVAMLDGRRCNIGFFSDITERKQVEESLRKERDRAQKYLDIAGVMFVAINNNGEVTLINQEGCEILGYKEEEIVGRNWFDNFIPERIRDEIKSISKRISAGETEPLEYYENPVLTKLGEERLIAWHNVGLIDEDGRIIGHLSSGEDITERKRAEEALKESEEFSSNLLNYSGNPIIVINPDTSIKFVNPALEKMTGFSSSELIGRKAPYPFWAKKKQNLIMEDLRKAMRKGARKLEEQFQKKSGEKFWIEITSTPIKSKGELKYYLANWVDITERKKAEQALKDSEEKLSALIKNSADIIQIVDSEGHITFISPSVESVLGYQPEELIGRASVELVHPDDLPIVAEGFKKALEYPNEPVHTVCRCKHKDGTWRVIEGRGINHLQNPAIKGFISNLRDITNRKRAEEEKQRLEQQLSHQQKLESIGTLAGGVAHEINNPITGIMNYAQLISDRLEEESPLNKYARGIIKETERVATIVRNLLTFARDEKQTHSPALMLDIVRNTLSLIQTVIRHDQIKLEVDVPEDLPKIKCRSQQIQQVLMNLMTNARDALNEKYSGYHKDKVIEVTALVFDREDKKWLRTTVEDYGNGIPEELKERIFDPFFTTKPREKGTGLGLSISHGIVMDHHGELHVESEPGKYTRFHLDLPVDNDWSLDESKDKAE
jgi:PAS domain S-box-containing protein